MTKHHSWYLIYCWRYARKKPDILEFVVFYTVEGEQLYKERSRRLKKKQLCKHSSINYLHLFCLCIYWYCQWWSFKWFLIYVLLWRWCFHIFIRYVMLYSSMNNCSLEKHLDSFMQFIFLYDCNSVVFSFIKHAAVVTKVLLPAYC